MACYHPIDCWRVPDASSKSGYRIVFGSSGLPPERGAEPCTIPCGKCIGCRLAYSRQWAVRCVHEASLHDRNCFLTLTFDDVHLSQKFDNLPTLSAQFIQDNPPVSRILAVRNEPQFIIDSYIEMKCARPMPVYGVPGLVDHF